MRRVLVVGVTGAGKTTAARRIAALIDAPYHEMDALAIGPRWSTPPELVDSVARIVAGPSWVFDSHGYDQVQDLMWSAADTIVWLDYPARIVLPRVLRRSLARSASGREVFGGNRETWRGWLSGEHPVWWSIRSLRPRRRLLASWTTRSSSRHLRTVRLTHPRELREWLATLAAGDDSTAG